jgi:2-polyprenyl-3-methyl-5-hydroxy-6-metoxy-1,4-benzoquinol methylase
MTFYLLNPEQASKYWDDRHQSTNTLQAGGDKGLSDAANKLFYALRIGKLLELIGRKFNLLAPLQVLDAGCGKGVFSDLLSRGGYRVIGIDSSKTAIEYCLNHCSGDYYCADIYRFKSINLFDVIYSIDVMFHILDDKVWEESFTNLCNMVTSDGLLIITDTHFRERWILGNYIVHRSIDEYTKVAQQSGISLKEFHPYNFGGNPIGFYVFERLSGRCAS